MHLGASKKDYYIGCLISYGIFGVWYLVCQHNDPFAD